MHIVIPTADYPPIEGGISSVSLQLSRELVKLGHEVTVIAPYFPKMDEFDAQEPTTVLRFRGYHFGWFRFFPMFLKSIPHLKRADLVLGINVSYGALMAYAAKAPYLTFAYAYEFLKFAQTPLLSSLLRKVYAQSHRCISISGHTTLALENFGVASEKIATILPGAPATRPITTAQKQSIRQQLTIEEGPLLLAVGRLIPRKGHRVLLAAMPAILERYPEATLVCVGRGPLMETLQTQAQELQIQESIRFTGYRSDEEVATLYATCDLFVLPTGQEAHGHVEGFGLVFAEASAYGKPAIAGRSGGTVDAVLDGETGLIIDPEDSVACAEAVLSLLDDPEKAQRLGEAGKRRVESELNWEAFTKGVMQAVEPSND